MAIRKAKVQEQVAEAVARSHPGDRPLATVHAVSGPPPPLMLFFGFIMLFVVKYYFVTVTDRALVVHRAVKFTGRPGEVVFSLPREQARYIVGGVRHGHRWHTFRLTFPGDTRPTRMNVAGVWSAEFGHLLHALGAAQPGR